MERHHKLLELGAVQRNRAVKSKKARSVFREVMSTQARVCAKYLTTLHVSEGASDLWEEAV